jgi:hypothetical protein
MKVGRFFNMPHPLKSQLINVIVQGTQDTISNTIDTYGNPVFIKIPIFIDLILKPNSSANYFRSLQTGDNNRTDYYAYINKAWKVVDGSKVVIKDLNISTLSSEFTFSNGKLSFIRREPTLKVIDSVFGKKYSVIVEGSL